jgi:succinoglycan biosynthesis protein ExoM
VAESLSVCIATYRRTEKLRLLLEDLARQTVVPDEVVIADNDTAGSARETVEAFRTAGCPFKLVYGIQPERSISSTRNQTVHQSSGDWLAFVDDDERAPPDWLERLLSAVKSYGAQGVLGPVEPEVPDSAPAWIKRGKFYDWPHLPTGAVVPGSHLRFGNVLLAGAPLRALPGPFDPAYGVSTGEDGDMLMRLIERGAKVIWCDEAPVFEPVEPKRLAMRWLLQRAFSGGQYFGRLVVTGRLGHQTTARKCIEGGRWVVQMIVALVLGLLVLPLGRHRALVWWIKAWANAGKLTAFSGWRYGEYA